MFMICVAANQPSSLENVAKWKNEIAEIEPEKPVALILTKSDLADIVDEELKVTPEEIAAKKTKMSFQLHAKTSSKAWEDFNVHKAFNRALTFAYAYKYEIDE